MTILTWLHLTDWHQKGADFDRKVVRDKLLEDIRQRVERVGPDLAKVDFVVFSGDLACFAKKEEYQSAQKELLEPVLAALDLPPNRLFMVPGNHDFDRSATELLPPALQRPLADNAAAHKWLAETLRPRTLEPFAAYREFVGALTGQASPDYASIQRLELSDVSVALLGLNSAWMCARNKKRKEVDDKGHLLIGEPQIHDALTAIDDADLRIAVLHHPFEWLADFDREIVEDRLKETCHFILHGHEHKQKVNISGGTGGDCIVIPAGASYDRRVAANPRYVNAYNWVSLDLAAGKGVVYLRRWNESQTKWQADGDTCSGGCLALDKLPKGLLIPQGQDVEDGKISAWLRAALAKELAAASPRLLAALAQFSGCVPNGLLRALMSGPVADRIAPIHSVTKAAIAICKGQCLTGQDIKSCKTSLKNIAGYLAMATLNQQWIGHADPYHNIHVNRLMTAGIYHAGLARVPAMLQEGEIASNAFSVECGLTPEAAIDNLERSIFIKCRLLRVEGRHPEDRLSVHEREELCQYLLTLASADLQAGTPRCAAVFIHRSKFDEHTLNNPDARDMLAKRLSDGKGRALIKIIVWGPVDGECIPPVLVVNEPALVIAINNLLTQLGEDI